MGLDHCLQLAERLVSIMVVVKTGMGYGSILLQGSEQEEGTVSDKVAACTAALPCTGCGTECCW